MSFVARLWFAWVCFFRVVFDGAFAARAFAATGNAPAERSPEALPESSAAPKPRESARTETASTTSALQLLALFQREGRFVDFLEQDIAAFSDADIGSAARVVHAGCKKALRSHASLTPVRAEDEGSTVSLDAGFSPSEIKLSGNVGGNAPYRGVLRHRGWRAESFNLPMVIEGHDTKILAPAEVEL